MAAEDVKLLGYFASPFVVRVKIALNIKSINYEFIEENLSEKSDMLLKSNPIHQKIPVLFHGGKPICESLIIVEYINDFWSNTGPSILSSDPHGRALERFWAAYIDDKLFPALRELRATKSEDAILGVVEKIVQVLLALEDAFVTCSKGNPYFGGEAIGLVDIALGCCLTMFRVLEKRVGFKVVDETKMPNLAAWAEKICQHPSVMDALPDVEKLTELYQRLLARQQAGAN